ncbi:hypothetical protein [Tritonibacter mobilis]|uniref:hypothetical protein n=1 Tax=Tritonibacter mobilis TaxID=379347 RepID=UPI000326F59D|nr:hypothetical protein [Tritonibacter mobilis]
MSDEIVKIRDKVHEHSSRIAVNETNIKNIQTDVSGLEENAKKVVWIVITFVVVGVLTFVFKGGF